MTLLRGLGVEELSKPELTGEWEHKLAQIEHGQLGRKEFMDQIAEMTHHVVKKTKKRSARKRAGRSREPSFSRSARTTRTGSSSSTSATTTRTQGSSWTFR